VPGETMLIIAAVYTKTGQLSIWLVALIAFIAAILGDNVGFAIGHFGGRPLAERYGKYILLTPERLDKTANFFDRHGGKVIVIARFIEGLRQANGIIAGMTGMHWKKFIPFNMLGAALWVGVWVSIGYFSGSNIDSIYKAATRYELFFGIAVGLLILAWLCHRFWKYRKERIAKIRGAGDTEPAEAESGPAESSPKPEGTATEPEAAEPEPEPEPEPERPAREP
jgi:membrane protein DedA with SNARE-associated domain